MSENQERNQDFINEVEVNVLSAMIQSPKACESALTLLKDQDFTVKNNQVIFQTIVELFKNNKGIDVTTISDTLVKKNFLARIGGIDYLSYLIQNYISDANVKEHINILVERTTKRQLGQALKKIEDDLQGDKKITDILIDAEAEIVQVSSERNSEELLPISESIDDVVEKIEQLQKSNQNLTGITSGINNLDNLTSGFQSGDFIILAARPSMGKTALALNFALNAANSLKQKDEAVLIFSLEMPKDQLITRMISCQGNFDAHKLRSKFKFTQDDWRRISNTAEQLKQKTIIIDDSPGLRILELQTKLRKLVREYDIKLVIIDYLQLLTGSTSSESRQQEVSNISRSLKISARELNIPIICLSQLSRLVERREEKRPLMSDLRESGAIEQDADLIMFLYRDDYYKEKNGEDSTKETQENHVAEIIISKHRNGPTGKVETVFIPKWGKFENYQNS
ncbi:replicative DNA helicase [Spiroplasma platyhelix]|uniref:Replicative DNA helicase n=1 Tax=Spiroplasma platyhelix PALS-1 TaxID=1276218 RepID=A0A846UDD2_9MOLU|nr:replicative DNA helicase [Spiroplasma platyhelix]MBE4704147.1 Replicative DNA helicase [Spiroplasma platyhelix PALS-1]NKE38518.1 replicative DNA helicase [Spiroplasma platyhelix PALS-1]UJB29405.1 replicative DNA helicase [Spiroplasma platyhelix PALS-1]